jgi:anti-sigma regulatory factor (Ser/Thr protein kinase)
MDGLPVSSWEGTPPDPFRHVLKASPAELAPMRARLRGWARGAGLDDELVETIVLGVSEAAANSIEHGLRYDEQGTVSVLARVLPDGRLEATVVDDGSWREPETRAGAARGRGMRIIDALMDEVGVESRAAGTVVRMGLRAS